MTTANTSDVFSTTALASLVVAGLSLGAVYAFNYTQLGQLRWPGDGAAAVEDTPSQGRDEGKGKGPTNASGATTSTTTTTMARKSRQRKKGTVGAGDEDGDEGEDEGPVGQSGAGGPTAASFPRVVPGDLVGVGVDVGSSEASILTPSGAKTHKKKKPRTKKQKQQQKQKQKHKLGDRDASDDPDAGSETDKEDKPVRVRVVRSGDSTDASVSRYPSAAGPGDAALPGSSRAAATRGHVGASASARLASPSYSREDRPSLSFDTDSSWTHVNRHRVKSEGEDGPRGPADVTSSDVASTASDSPVAERMNVAARDMRGGQRTLAEKLVPRPRKTGVDDMLERPDVPTLARVMRVQPPADEKPVPGFSWEDYGDVVEDSILVHDADEEDDGDWGVVKSRHRTRHPQTTATPASASHTPSSAPETMTKKQRQNARKRELAKSTKAETEAARLEGLAKHKRELERLRIIEQSQQVSGKKPSGGMHAAVDDRGKLVWE